MHVVKEWTPKISVSQWYWTMCSKYMHIICSLVNTIGRVYMILQEKRKKILLQPCLIVAFDSIFGTWNDNMHKSRLLTRLKKIMIGFNGHICLRMELEVHAIGPPTYLKRVIVPIMKCDRTTICTKIKKSNVTEHRIYHTCAYPSTECTSLREYQSRLPILSLPNFQMIFTWL